ncbi:hypothetical protein B0T17DRAFT_108930 [Bombardia bombarda]|uniref:Uncharacterized protein n=1 Tax=Bombardia bombarda TaxID=252184 RepID=A0AA39XNP9_9PEZI|nr:hypothetical protein B0T17DRAFT_108930 [Bombardia bombarda]
MGHDHIPLGGIGVTKDITITHEDRPTPSTYSWLPDPADSVGHVFGEHSGSIVWSVKEDSHADLVFRAIRYDVDSALKEAFLEKDQPTAPFRMFMVGTTPETSTPTILIDTRDGEAGYRWRAGVALKERRVLDHYPGLLLGQYWPSPVGDILPSSTYEPSLTPSHVLSRGAASTLLQDSGYGSASNTATIMYKLPETQEEEVDDGASIITDNLSLDLSRDLIDAYVETFAELLFNSIDLRSVELTPDLKLAERLPALLRAFALQVAVTEASAEGKAVSTFIRQNRGRIANAFGQMIKQTQADVDAHNDDDDDDDDDEEDEDGEINNRGSLRRDGMTFQQKVEQWPDFFENNDLWAQQDIPEDIDYDFDNEDEQLGSTNNPSDLDMARINFIVNTSSYSWLLAALQSRCRLDYDEARVRNSIRRGTISTLKLHRGNRALRTQHVVLRMRWNPRSFIKEQGYRGPRSILTALTITGSATNAQLLSCEQYAKQTWPMIGETMLEGMVEALEVAGTYMNSPASAIQKSLFDDTQISIQVVGEDVQVECIGLLDSILEVVEVFAWMGAALREAYSPESITYTIAHVWHEEQSNHQDSKVQFRIDFSEENIPPNNNTNFPRGDCWRSLLKNPVIARGFPVPFRPENMPGLEVPLGAMALLVDAARLTIFNNRAVLKGFNAAIYPTVYTDDSIIQWHFVVNEDGTRLPYSDGRIHASPELSLPTPIPRIQASRHILGWAPKVSYNIGSPLANYDIGWSSPDFIGPGCALEKFTISGGPGFISAGAEFSLGRKDKTPTINRHTPYFDTLNSLSSSYVVLYDIEDHRAWLSNGLHALLHLVRASLKHDSDSELAVEYVLDPSKLEEDVDVSSPRAAINFLRNRRNLEQIVFPNLDEIRTEEASTTGGPTSKTEYRTSSGVLLKDRVNQMMYVLEQLIDHQASLDTYSSGLPLKLTPRGKLEGYRFMDIAARRPLTPRVTHLKTFSGGGKSWVDFTRAIKAVTLFGEGFGDLLAPDTSVAGTCPRWKRLPKNKDYLAVSAYDMARILRQEGSATSKPMKLAPGVFWQKPTVAFEPCACQAKSKSAEILGMSLGMQRSCDRVQVLLPRNLLLRQDSSSSSSTNTGGAENSRRTAVMSTEGAVIFGRSDTFPWRWPEQGDPRQDTEGARDEEQVSASPLSSQTSKTQSVRSPNSSASVATGSTSITAQSGRSSPGEFSTQRGQGIFRQTIADTKSAPRLWNTWRKLTNLSGKKD